MSRGLRRSFGLAALLLLACCARSGRSHPGNTSGQWPGGPPGAWPPGQQPSGPGGPTGAVPPGDAQRMLDAHNRARAEHCAAPLVWAPDLAATAKRWADTLASRGCGLAHSSGPLGENLAGGTSTIMSPEQAVDMWVRERSQYDFQHGGFSMEAGHFTQVAWKGTQRLGCGSAVCGANTVWVCNYDPPGNMEGEFQRNVGPAGCRR